MHASARIVGVVLWIGCVVGLAVGQGRGDAREEGWRRFEELLGTGLELRRGPGEAELEARGALRVAPAIRSAEERQRATRRVLVAAEELLGVRADSLAPVLERELAGLHVVQLEQRVDGAVVRDAHVGLRFLEDGRLLLLRARGLARGGWARPFAIARSEAREVAQHSLPEDPARLSALDARRVALRGGDGRPRAAWEVDVVDWTRVHGAWTLTLDGADGTLIEVRPGETQAIAGKVEGRGMASGPQTSGAPTVLPMGNVHVHGYLASAALLRITDDDCEDEGVAMSADGTRIVWVSDCSGDREIWTASSDGSGKLRLTFDPGDDHSPAISADGSRIVFVSDRDGDEELFAIGSDGTGLVQLTHDGARNHSPSLSGDGARVVYLSDFSGHDEVFTLLVAAPSPVQLTSGATAAESPRISLDGSRIVWVSREDGDAEIFTMDPSGGSLVQVTVNGVDDVEPDISPDGTRVVFASRLPPTGFDSDDPSGSAGPSLPGALQPARRQYDLFLAGADGTGLMRLTESEADEREPSFDAAGEGIAYTTDEGAKRVIEVMDLESSALVRLTEDSPLDLGPRPGSGWHAGAFVARGATGEIWVWNLLLPGAFVSGTTDEAGDYSLAVPDGLTSRVTAALRGEWARVVDLDPRWREQRAAANHTSPAVDADLVLNPTGAVEGPTAQVTAYRHTDLAHHKLEAIMRRPPLALLGTLPIDERLVVRANFPQPVPNAFYSLVHKHTTFFIGDGPTRPNTAYDTVVLHETGHFYDDLIGGLSPGSSCEAPWALSEGQADVLASLVSGSAVIGEAFFGPGTALRDYTSFHWASPGGARGRQYDCLECPLAAGLPEIHFHGEAFAGFARDLYELVGVATAEDLLVGVLLGNPPDMQAAVTDAFVLAASPAFGGSGDPATSPLYASLCRAAARHDFDCPPRPDFPSLACGICAPVPTAHRVIGTEWLGDLVFTEIGCESFPSSENDGVSMPGPTWTSGLPVPLTFTLAVDPLLQHSGRYGRPAGPPPPGGDPIPQLPRRRVYLNVWLFVPDSGSPSGVTVHKLLGHGSPNGTTGPDSIEPGLNTVAFNPDTWSGSTTSFVAFVVPPAVADMQHATLRVRIDHGEDAGRLSGCLSHPSLDGHCGVARWGEVEDYQITIMP